jgi:DNA-binding protein HU-beta
MNKNELVSAVADAASISKGDAQSAVDAVFSVITGELKKGGDVRLVGFGNFTVSKRAASTGRNPQTGAEVQIPARTVPKFSAGKGLKDAVNKETVWKLYSGGHLMAFSALPVLTDQNVRCAPVLETTTI